jgi:hypothetical protein
MGRARGSDWIHQSIVYKYVISTDFEVAFAGARPCRASDEAPRRDRLEKISKLHSFIYSTISDCSWPRPRSARETRPGPKTDHHPLVVSYAG